jgi:CDP-4-dehydro-6-deoxyglucose reductase/ferredoxin-NAD(P)+ reductase (naphthalene dioxygenase ferredoxin-specific)
MGHRITIAGLDATIEAEPGETILDAALRGGVALPFGCQSGNCGACKVALLSGGIALHPYSDFALEEGERLQGLVLGCRAVPMGDCDVALLEAADWEVHPQRDMKCRVVSVDDATHDIRRVRMEVLDGGPLVFSAGQYAILEFHVRLVPGGAVTPFVRERLKPGDELRVRGPMGTASWRQRHGGPILAVAGGSGLAPIKSIVEAALASGARQPIRLYAGARAERDLYLLDHLAALAARHPNLEVVPVLSEPLGPTTRRTGFLHEALRADIAGLDGWKAYLAGPPAMVEACVDVLAELGLPRADCHADAFYTEADKQALQREAAR